jgi:hypothetical protein
MRRCTFKINMYRLLRLPTGFGLLSVGAMIYIPEISRLGESSHKLEFIIVRVSRIHIRLTGLMPTDMFGMDEGKFDPNPPN